MRIRRAFPVPSSLVVTNVFAASKQAVSEANLPGHVSADTPSPNTVGNVVPIVTVPLGFTRNSDVPLELAISKSGAVELAEPTTESKAKGVVVLIPTLPEL